jgi:hypothetical protein
LSVVEGAQKMADMVAAALKHSGYEADFTARSLWELDRFFDEQARKGRPRKWGLLAKDTSLRLFSIGAYLGEVLRRELGGEWEDSDEDGDEAMLNLTLRLPDGRIVRPVQQAVKRLASGRAEALVPFAGELGLEAGPKPQR